MPNQSIKSPSGKDLFIVANKTTTESTNNAVKKIFLQRKIIEVIVSDSRLKSMGSQWGHAAIVVDGKVYSRAHDKYFTTTYSDYIERNSYRDSIGLELAVSPREAETVKKELERRVAVNTKYSIFDNNCSSNVADALEMIDILAHDPRGIPEPSSPAELLAIVSKSNRLVKKNSYPKR